MVDHKEYEIRRTRMETDPLFKNFKEGVWESPNKSKAVEVCASYEAAMINVRFMGCNWSSSIYPILWDHLFSEWTYLGKIRDPRFELKTEEKV